MVFLFDLILSKVEFVTPQNLALSLCRTSDVLTS